MKVVPASLRRRRSTDGDEPRSRAARVGSLLLWWTLPVLAAVLVCTYVGLAVVRGVNPPVVPVEGISMRPLLHAGDLVLLKKADVAHLKVGDIIAFRTTKDVQNRWHVPGSYVHRIVKIEKGAYGLQFQTKGDNVSGHDPFWTVQHDVIGEYAGKIRGAGFPILFIRSKQGKILIGAVLVILALYALLGVLERRSEAQELNMLTLAGIVEEARELKVAMEHSSRFPGVPPPTAAPVAALDAETREALRASTEVQATMRELVGAIGEYGRHLASHTEVMKNLAATTGELQRATVEMRAAIAGGEAVAPAPAPPPEPPAAPPPSAISSAVLSEPSASPPSAPPVELKRSLRGYSRESVEALLADLSRRLESSEQRLGDLERANTMLAAERDSLKDELARQRELEQSLTATLALAQKTAAEITARAEHEAAEMRAAAQVQATDLVQRAAAERSRLLQETDLIREHLQSVLTSLPRETAAAETATGGEPEPAPQPE